MLPAVKPLLNYLVSSQILNSYTEDVKVYYSGEITKLLFNIRLGSTRHERTKMGLAIFSTSQ